MVNWMRFKYSWAPFLASLIWGATLVTLFVLWRTDGPPWYKQNRTVLYISYVGAKWKGIFVPGAVLTAICYIVTLILDVELRRHERIPNFLRRRESAFAVLSIIFGSIGALSLAGLSIFDVHNHHTAHWIFTTFFIGGVFLNGLFNLFEIKYLSRSHFRLGYLRRNAYAKLGLATVGLVFAVAFGVLQATCSDNSDDPFDKSCDANDSVAGVFEWAIAVIFVGFLFTYAIDFRAEESPPPALQQIQQQEAMGGPAGGQQEMQQGQVNAGPKPDEAPIPQIGSGVA